jgi:hypothetical protein
MRTLEHNHPVHPWIDRLLNSRWLCLDDARMRTWAVARDAQGWYLPGRASLYYNGYFMVRLCWPVGVFVHVRWSPVARLQLGVGFKLNGRFGLIARYQTDADAAKGVHGPNHGQATGFDRGTA